MLRCYERHVQGQDLLAFVAFGQRARSTLRLEYSNSFTPGRQSSKRPLRHVPTRAWRPSKTVCHSLAVNVFGLNQLASVGQIGEKEFESHIPLNQNIHGNTVDLRARSPNASQYWSSQAKNTAPQSPRCPTHPFSDNPLPAHRRLHLKSLYISHPLYQHDLPRVTSLLALSEEACGSSRLS